jgi:chromate reductase, NAD(P)H dehydrogenase (quinone)
MTTVRTVSVFVGSLRQNSWSGRIADGLAADAPPSLRFVPVEIGALPLYNQDLETEPPPPAWAAFRHAVRVTDALLFVTPEYNRSVPAALKNALDVGSRPHGHSVWDGKPGAVVSVSPGPVGGFGANHHLRQALVYLNVPTMSQPEAYLGGVVKTWDPEGGFNAEMRAHLKKIVTAFASWVEVAQRR